METTEGSKAADQFFDHDLKKDMAQTNLDEDVE